MTFLLTACSGPVKGGGTGASGGSAGTGGSAGESGSSGSTDQGGSTGQGGSAGQGGSTSSGGSNAAWVTLGELQCNGSMPGGDPSSLQLLFDKQPLVCKSACQDVFPGKDTLDCATDWRIQMGIPAAVGVYQLSAVAVLFAAPDPSKSTKCEVINVANGQIEIQSVSDTLVTGIVSGVTIPERPDIDANGKVLAPHCN